MSRPFRREYSHLVTLDDDRGLTVSYVVLEYAATFDSPDDDAISPYTWELDGIEIDRAKFDAETEAAAVALLAKNHLSDDGV